MTFLYGVQYPNVGIFCVFVVYICVYASFSSDLRELKWREALFCGYDEVLLLYVSFEYEKIAV